MNKEIFIYMKRIIIGLSLLLCVGVFQSSFGQDRTDVRIKNDVFSVSYNETLEQPNWVEYEVRNITKKFDRGSMDFYTPKNVYTSDNEDYKNHLNQFLKSSDNSSSNSKKSLNVIISDL